MLTESQLTGSVREGDVLAGKYRIEKILGAGGMGVVVAAHHLHLDERVAIKFLLPEVLGNAEVMGRFAREARAAVKIKSEHVARVIDVGSLENGAPYMVMEYLDGHDLSAWLELRGALPIEQAVEFVLQACEAIADAHGLGIVHRDLKPANLYCVRRSDGVLSIKVLDFGISKVTGSQVSGPDMTRTSSVMGSPLYMSPEQLRSSRDVDARTDIWSLGVILYELMTKKAPHTGDSLPELCMAIVAAPTPSIRSLRPDVPLALEEVINKCLEKDRNSRFSNVAELAIALAPFGPRRARSSVERVKGIIQSAGLSASALSIPVSEAPSPSLAVPTKVAWGHTAGPKIERRTWVAVGVLGALMCIGLAAFLLFRGSIRPKAAADTSTVPQTGTGPSESNRVLPAEATRVAVVASNPPPSAEPIAVASAANSASISNAPPPALGDRKGVAAKSNDKPSVAKSISAKPTPSESPKQRKETTTTTPSTPAARPAAKGGVYDDMQ